MNIMMAEFGSAGHIHVELAYDAMNVSNYGSLGAPKNVPWGYYCKTCVSPCLVSPFLLCPYIVLPVH